MALAAAIFLTETLKELLDSDHISPHFSKSDIVSLYVKVSSLKCFLEKDFLVPKTSTTTVQFLETAIKGAISNAEDAIQSGRSEYDSMLEKLDSVAVKAARLAEHFDRDREHRQGRRSTLAVLSRFLQGKKKLVGIEDSLTKLRNQLEIGKSSRLKVVAVVGMIGIGKTTLVNEVYDDPSIGQVFTHQAWAKLGPVCTVRQILLGLLRSMDLDFSQESSAEELSDVLRNGLKGRRYLVVLDDICDIMTWEALMKSFPNERKGSRIILTTRLTKVALYAAGGASENVHQVRFLNEDESWELLRYAAIGEDSCGSELMKIGRTIARKCDGLPLSIISMGSLLSRMWPKAEIWDIAASDRGIHTHAMLLVTQSVDRTENFSDRMRICFLYMVAFPLCSVISASKLQKLWIAEGFLDKTSYHKSAKYLVELVERSLLLVRGLRSIGGIKSCSIHSAIWPFFALEASKVYIYCLESIKDHKDTGGCRRIFIHKNILLSIRDVHDSMATARSLRSLLCTGPYHPYPMRVSLYFRRLSVLDALGIRFYKFPDEVLKLICLRFLALSVNRGEIPTSVSNLQFLQFLIVLRHSSIKSPGVPCFLPMEIWNMNRLRHLQVAGSDLPTSFDVSTLLPNLLTMSDVSGLNCTREVLSRTPNLKKLGIRIELPWDAADSPMHLFDHLSYLGQLETFKCIVRNPFFGPQVAALPYSVFPSSLMKLTLSGAGFSWENMKEIARLPKLEVLKLRCHAFRGPKWEVNMDEFCSLKFLLLEDLDIEQWRADDSSFTRLERLAILHCYTLHEIPLKLGNVPTLKAIELVDCSPSAVDSVMRMKEAQRSIGNEPFSVHINLRGLMIA